MRFSRPEIMTGLFHRLLRLPLPFAIVYIVSISPQQIFAQPDVKGACVSGSDMIINGKLVKGTPCNETNKKTKPEPDYIPSPTEIAANLNSQGLSAEQSGD